MSGSLAFPETLVILVVAFLFAVPFYFISPRPGIPDSCVS